MQALRGPQARSVQQEQQEPRECQELPEQRAPRDLEEPQEQQVLLEQQAQLEQQERRAPLVCKASADHKEIQAFEGLRSPPQR